MRYQSIVDLIARTTRWVHPDVFRAFPVWYPRRHGMAARSLVRGVLAFWKMELGSKMICQTSDGFARFATP
jgi:hypothetical protein